MTMTVLIVAGTEKSESEWLSWTVIQKRSSGGASVSNVFMQGVTPENR